MTFQIAIEEILKSAPRDINFFIQSNKMFWSVFSTQVAQCLKDEFNNTKALASIHSTVVKVIIEAENSISHINYRRVPSYIEFYNKDTKRCVRIIISTINDFRILMGFYSNYEKNIKNNHFSEDTKMLNEFLGPIKITQEPDFVKKVCAFLLGSVETPYVNLG